MTRYSRRVREGRRPGEPTEIDAQLGYYFLAFCANGCRDGACVQEPPLAGPP